MRNILHTLHLIVDYKIHVEDDVYAAIVPIRLLRNARDHGIPIVHNVRIHPFDVHVRGNKILRRGKTLGTHPLVSARISRASKRIKQFQNMCFAIIRD